MRQTCGLVRVVAAGPLHVAAFSAFGSDPERRAFSELSAWARPLGLLDDPSGFLLFGRNDPPPEHDGDQYGYRYMLALPAGVDVEGEVIEEDLPRATYATARATLATIGGRWKELYAWAERQGYQVVGHGLEEHLSLPEGESVESLVLDLWLPVDERARRGRVDRGHGGCERTRSSRPTTPSSRESASSTPRGSFSRSGGTTTLRCGRWRPGWA